MKKLKHIQIDENIWEQLKIYCSQNGYSLKGYVQQLIIKNINNGNNEKMLEMQTNEIPK
jgi:hypothetical protein